LEEFFRQLLGVLDITNGFNWRIMAGITAITFLGEIYVQVPLLMESFWMIVGYQVGTQTTFVSVTNTIILFLCAQLGRQLMMLAVFLLFPVINRPFSRFYERLIKPKRYTQWLVKRFRNIQYFNEESFLTLGSSSFGMLTPLNGPIKLLLIIKRNLKTLLLATLISSTIFDCIYIVAGAVFHTTQLNITFLPLFILIGFLVVMFVRTKLYNRYKKEVR
jgi:hypothetical protein